MTNYPDIQTRVRQEIHDAIGPHKPPSMKDKPNLPFTEACILETQRMGDIVPLGVPHTTVEDIVFRGYDIPKGTTVMSNLYSVHRDPSVWENPHDFNPDRFLDSNGKIHKKEQLIPFSMGMLSISMRLNTSSDPIFAKQVMFSKNIYLIISYIHFPLY